MINRKTPVMRVLSIGECMAELAPLDQPAEFRLGFAGDTFNTAWYLRRLRQDIGVAYLTAVGCDEISDRMLVFMEGAGIDTGAVLRVPDRSVGMYMISLLAGERSFSYWRDTSAARRLADDADALARAFARADLIYFSGITLAILHDEARACLLRRLQEARGNGKRIAFDPNLRPGLWPDTRQMTEAVMQAAAVSDIVLPSFEDEAVHFGDPGPAATADRYAGAGALTVVVKNGADPVHFLHEGLRGDVVVPPVAAVVDTTSAGDSFNAGLLATMDGALPIVARIRLASYVAGQAVGGKGALVAFDPSELSPWLIPAEPGAAAGPGI